MPPAAPALGRPFAATFGERAFRPPESPPGASPRRPPRRCTSLPCPPRVRWR